MDDRRFDTLTKHLAVSGTRRQLLGGLVASALGLVRLGGAKAASCRAPGNICREGANCCSGLCSEDSATRRKVCVCPPGTQQCKDACVDPATAYSSDPNNCGACGVKCPRTRCSVGVCNAGVCELAPDPSTVGVSCDDGNPCTTNDICQGDGTCKGTPISCSVNEPKCQTATCNPATGKCETTNLPLGTNCADDDRCDGEEACDGNGVCAAGTPVQCPQPSDPCQSATCDSASGQCVTTNKQNGLACSVDFIPNGVCCSGICSQCCSDASACTSLFAETDNVVFFCDDPAQVGNLNCRSECDPSVIPPTNPIYTDPAVVGGVNQQCGSGGQTVPCLTCRLPVGSECSTDAQCCGFCINGICATLLSLGETCDPATSGCTTGTSCGHIIGSNTANVCCLPADSACSADEDCCQPGGVQNRCILGVCKTRLESGESCEDDFDCRGPLTCIAGVCGPKSPLGGPCDSNGDCPTDASCRSGICVGTSDPGGTCDSDEHCVTPATCISGICRLPNGAACTSGDLCAIGTCIDCGGGNRICGDCCGNGFDPVDCGDQESEKLCCDHACIYRNDDLNCGGCGIDCTCGGADPYRYCTTVYDSQTPAWDWRAICTGTYSAESGHCTDNSGPGTDWCSSTCPPPELCDCANPVTSLFCYAACIGQAENLMLSTCGEVDDYCLGGRDETCCGDTITCETVFNCPQGTTFCLSDDYRCVAAP